MTSVLTVQSVGKRYGKSIALDDVSVELGRGEALAVIGANGAGKSTLIKCILGLLRFDGHIAVDGVDVARDGRRARAAVGYVPQHPALHGDLTVAETVQFYAALRRAAVEQGIALVEELGLGAHLDKAVEALSGGMRQRLALALGLLGDPALLVFDEPASGLDVAARLELRHIVQQQRQRGRAVVLSTHWLEDLPHVADRVLHLREGRTVFLGPSAQLQESTVASARMYLRMNGSSASAATLLRGAFPGAVDMTGDWLVVQCGAKEKARVIQVLSEAQMRVLDMHVDEELLETPGAGSGLRRMGGS